MSEISEKAAVVAEAPLAPVPFKKRARKGKKKKKPMRKPITKPPEEEEEEDAELSTVLSDMISEQKNRQRAKGIKAKTFKGSKNEESDEEEVDPDGYDPKVGGIVTKDKLALLDAQYTGATKKLGKDENPHLLKYLEEKMGNKTAVSPGSRQKSEMDKLYELSKDMKSVREGAKGAEVTEDKALGGAVAFGTGIAEVELPIEYQLENIERTEVAKAEFIKKQNSRTYKKWHNEDEMDGHGTGGNFGSNFRQHNRDFKKRKREEYRKFEARGGGMDSNPNIVCHACGKPGHKSSQCPTNAGGGGGGGAAGPGRAPRPQMASDDIMMRRFWTRMRNQRRM